MQQHFKDLLEKTPQISGEIVVPVVEEELKIKKEGFLLTFPKKGHLGITDNYRGITLITIAAKIYNLMLLNRIRGLEEEPKWIPYK